MFDSSGNKIYILFGTEGVRTIDEMDESGMENFRTNVIIFHIMIPLLTVLLLVNIKIIICNLFYSCFFTIFDFINFVNTGNFRADRFRFPYCNTASDRFQLFSIFKGAERISFLSQESQTCPRILFAHSLLLAVVVTLTEPYECTSRNTPSISTSN